MKALLLFFLMIISIRSFGCTCGIIPLIDNYQHSDFIATAKILTVVQDASNKDYHDIEVALINVYKGTPIKKLKIHSWLMSSCAFLPDENTTWLIFASKNQEGSLIFGSCSGSVQVDRHFDLVQYPNLDIRYKNSMNLKLDVLSFLHENKISSINKFDVGLIDSRICTEYLKGFIEKNRFAIYEVDVNQDLTVGEVKVLKSFDNKNLSEMLTNCLQTNLQINTKNRKTIPEKTKLTIIYFYYPSDGKSPGFISTWDL
ncbi:MAG: hypothetical protein V4708_12700 [Bacteroidota bacterium]